MGTEQPANAVFNFKFDIVVPAAERKFNKIVSKLLNENTFFKLTMVMRHLPGQRQ